MAQAFRRFRSNWLSGGVHFLILVVAAQADSPLVWRYALAGMALVSFFAWGANYRRYRQIHDLPTSRIASAAQGYVELFGKAAQIPNCPVVSPLTNLPCCWYRYKVETKDSDNKWQEEDGGESVDHFLLVDGTGECVISPDGAEVLYARTSTWTQGERRYTESLLLPQGVLYAMGEFTTTGGANIELNENRDMSELLADWKKDRAHLLERFDADRDGTIDLNEWEAARLEARRQVQKEHAELRSGAGVNLLRKPADGRIFLLAGAVPEKIGRRFAIWSWVHLAFFCGAASASYLLFAGAR